MRSMDDIERALDDIFEEDDSSETIDRVPIDRTPIHRDPIHRDPIYGPMPAEEVWPVDPERRKRARRKRVGRRLRSALLVALATALVAGAVVVATRFLVPDRGEDRLGAGVPVPDQQVVAWTLWQDEPPGPVVVAVFATGGERGPVALGIPGYTVVNIPGYGVGTVGDVGRLGDPALVATTVGNVLGIEIDRFAGTTFSDLRTLVDAAGGIEVNDRAMDGGRVVSYLRRSGAGETGELRFLRGQEVLSGLLAAGAPLQAFPEEVRAIVRAAALDEVPFFELPVEQIGAGLARPDEQETARLVSEWFVPTAGLADGVRLVILNANGAPGIGERVATILVPAGFRLVSSGNADRFGQPDTQIVAATEAFLDEAELARRLLGVGRVFLGEQPTGVADVTVVVGRDFGGA